MDTAPACALAGAAGYLLGSIPFAWIAVQARKGLDLRKLGSGNVGATNAARVLGRRWFFVIFALDFGKGALPVLLAGWLFRHDDLAASLWVRAAAGAGAILGHSFPFALGFRGGKGVATGAGVLALLAPPAFAAGLVAFLAALAAWKYVSLGSVAGAIAAPAALFWFGRGRPPEVLLPVGSLVGAIAVWIVARHVPNLRRIARGTEPRLGEESAAAPPGGDP